MADQADFEEEADRRAYVRPRSGRNPVPTVQSYRQHKKEQLLESQVLAEEDGEPQDESKRRRAYNDLQALFKGQGPADEAGGPYPALNRNMSFSQPNPEAPELEQGDKSTGAMDGASSPQPDGTRHDNHHPRHPAQRRRKDERSATEVAVGSLDPKKKRKAMKKFRRRAGGREVTDPVTHLPIFIRDQTEKDLESVPENEAEPGTHEYTATGVKGASKSDEQLEAERTNIQRRHDGTNKVFPPPDFAGMRNELSTVYQQAMFAGLAIIAAATVLLLVPSCFGLLQYSLGAWGLAGFLGVLGVITTGVAGWIRNKVDSILENEIWEASRRQEIASLDRESQPPESVQWLNSLLASVWPLINPDLFSSLIDMIEDIMQASLPKAVKMVSVDDMGQGNEAVRILGVHWLPTGAASRSVGADGKLQPQRHEGESDRTGSGKNGAGAQDGRQQGQGSADVPEGMEAEEGDFVNLELALAYRTRSSGKSIKDKAKNAHIYLKFYLPWGITVPVWAEIYGFVATARLRLQLAPDPPFFNMCTLTFLGQPKASLSCVPLSRHSLNLMDVPLISTFVQSSIDAALAEYVAPKSLTLNLKDMLVGEDFKKNTTTRGMVWVFIKRARGFKPGDFGIGPWQGTSDSYVTVSWGKFGKPVASTRIIPGTQEPDWHEYACILVTPEELNAEEKLRLQLWDSDKWTADDDLGRVELDLDVIMHSEESRNKMQEREDQFHGADPTETMAGSLQWSVGYFPKTKINQKQIDRQTVNEAIRSKEQLKQYIADMSERKLREAGKHPRDEEVIQQKAQDYQDMEDAMIISAPPDEDYPSGILSIQIHNITGLEIQNLQRKDGDGGLEKDEGDEDTDYLPDSYCSIIINHQKIYKTRTKPKTTKPFFNAGTERFIRDWRTAEVMISVREAREHEDDPLIGMIYLPLSKVFAERSQIMSNYPLVGGIGYGRARVSLVWRSVGLQLSPNRRGWKCGTLEIKSVSPKGDLSPDLTECRLKMRSHMSRAKMHSRGGQWVSRRRKGVQSQFLPVTKRHSTSVTIQFRKTVFGPNETRGFAILWLGDLVDEEDETKTLKVWKYGKDDFERAKTCYEYQGIEEDEQPLGEIELSLKFWPGLSGFHKAYAAQSNNVEMRNVMECLDTVTDEKLDGEEDEEEEQQQQRQDVDEHENEDEDAVDSEKEGTEASSRKARKKLTTHTNDDSTPESTDDESDVVSDNKNLALSDFKKIKNLFHSPADGGAEPATSGAAAGHDDENDRGGVQSQLKDYKAHHKQLHRKHKGIMQWRPAREANHLGGKLSRLKSNVTQVFKHSDKGPEIETEI